MLDTLLMMPETYRRKLSLRLESSAPLVQSILPSGLTGHILRRLNKDPIEKIKATINIRLD
jgi:hypothetical protein